MMFDECVASWISRKSINCAPSTISGYKRLRRLYISGTDVAGKDPADIDEDDVFDLLAPLLARGCTRQAQLLQMLVVATLRDCVRRRVVAWSPVLGMEKVVHRSRNTPWLTLDQARQLLAWSKANDDPLYIAWLLMLCCGLRRGEMLGLMWQDIDFQRGLLHVERQKIRVDGQILICKPKSATSARDIYLDDHLLSFLRLQTPGRGFILDVSDQSLARALRVRLAAAGLPQITLHGLRHTLASVAAAEGVPIKSVQLIMGHASFGVTADIYTHVSDDGLRRAASSITHALIGARLEIV